MCGVIAALGTKASDQVHKGLGLLQHRGIRQKQTDGWRCSLGHVRLPIVGIGDENDQPVQDSRWMIAFVGEILDFKERGYEVCDLPLVADTWNQEGPNGFRYFDGFWSVVAVDHLNQEIHALVDYLSQKPLYVREDELVTAVASEPDAVARLAPIKFDEIYLSAVVKWGYCPEPWRTPYQNIRRMGPGEYVILKSDRRSIWKVVDDLKVLELTPRQLRTEIELAVRRRVLASDVPVACLVSGGLDSTIVYNLAKRHGSVHAYHVENGEREWADEVAPEAAYLRPDEVKLEEALEYLQEPPDLGSLIPQVALSKAIAGSGAERVCLTGDGADEFFGGYSRAQRYDSQMSDVFHELVGWHLPRLDRVMMRNQIEVRSPFLARRVAGAALGLERPCRTGKVILKELFKNIVPKDVLDSPKRPLRTGIVSQNREENSKRLVDLWRERCRRPD